MEIEKEEFEKVVKQSSSKSDICKNLGLHINGSGFRKVNQLLQEYPVDISHFDGGASKHRKYKIITKECPICSSKFEERKGNKREKTTCSKSCSNTYFRSGESNPNWKEDRYRTTCFFHHEKKCIVCDEKNIVTVHHLDENKKNNSPENLMPMCPTHHQYWHSRFRSLVYKKVIEYRDEFLINQKKKKNMKNIG